MASFDPSVPAMQPNNYTSNFSQGTDKASLQPLADVPQLNSRYFKPDYEANKTGEAVGKGLATLTTDGVSLADGIIKSNIDDKLNDGIDKIRDSFGVAQAADIGSGFAAAVGKGGQDGILSPDTSQAPAPVQKLGTQVDGLKEAYDQGQLSNSAYYAKLESYVRQVKQQFPGYQDDIDSMVSTKVGTTPANALRSAIQQDVTELAKKVSSQNDKWTTYENTNSQYIHTQWPDYEQRKSNGTAPSQAEVQNVVGRMQARDYSYSSRIAALNADKADDAAVETKATQLATQKAADISAHLVIGITNTMGIKSPQDMTQLLDDVRSGKRPPLTPDEKQALGGVFATMEQQYGIQFDKFINRTQDEHGLPVRPLSSYTTPDKLNAIRTQGLQSITDIKNGLFDEKYGIMNQTANWTKATTDAGEADFLRRAPVAAAVAAGRKLYGDQGITTLMTSSPPLMSAALEGFRQYNQGKIASGNYSLDQVFDDYKREGMNDGSLNRAAIADSVNTILHSEKMADATAGPKAVQHAFGPGNRTLLQAFNDKNQVEVFTQLTSPLVTKKIAKMDATSKKTYTDWADSGFTDVFQDQANFANQSVTSYGPDHKVDVTYDPNTQNFSYKRTVTLTSGRELTADKKLQGLNTAIETMKPIWKLEGKDPTEALYTLLPAAGIEPGTPIYKVIQEEYMKTHPAKEG